MEALPSRERIWTIGCDPTMTTLPPEQKRRQEKSGHGRKYRGQPSHAIPVWNGILEHREKMGPALWEFLWCLDKITIEDEHGIGWCLGKTPIDTKRIARDLQEHPNTAYENLERLVTEAYIVRKRTPRGYAIGVVNSRKFHAFRSAKSDSEKTPNQAASDSQKTVNHPKSDSQKRVNQSDSDSQKTGRVIHSFGDSDSQKTVIRRDSTVMLQEDTTVQTHTTGGNGSLRSPAPAYVSQLQKLIRENQGALQERIRSGERYGPLADADDWRQFKMDCKAIGVPWQEIDTAWQEVIHPFQTESPTQIESESTASEPQRGSTLKVLDLLKAAGPGGLSCSHLARELYNESDQQEHYRAQGRIVQLIKGLRKKGYSITVTGKTGGRPGVYVLRQN
jgi:hypothetical protein